MNTLQFIQKATQVHKNKYLYTNTTYVHPKEKVEIYCVSCKTFFRQNPYNHLNGHGCPICRGTSNTTIETLEALTKNLPYIFDYSNYTNGKSVVSIYCEKHKHTTYRTVNHIKTRQTYCSICHKNSAAEEKQAKAASNFITNATAKFGKLYAYDNVAYINATTKVKILCKRCNTYFEQIPHNHIRGAGCPSCAGDMQGWGKSRYIDKPTIFYVLQIDNVYKIGITTRSIGLRYSSEQTPFDVLYQTTFFDGELAWELEKLVLRTFRTFRYTGPRVLTTASNREIITKNPIPDLQLLIKELYE